MRKQLSWRKLLIFAFLICTAAVSLTYESILRQIGHFLVFEQEPRKADIIIVLNGRDAERSLAAVDLYSRGYADTIVMARGSKQPGSDEFWKRVSKDYFDSRIFFERAIEAMGIPKQSFRLIGNGVASTYDEAKVAKEFLQESMSTSALIVTSKWHSKRAFLTFRRMFDKEDEIEITIYPSRYDTFDPDSWWLHESYAELVFREYVRLFYYAILFRISPFEIFS